jgi:hypothetical protein
VVLAVLALAAVLPALALFPQYEVMVGKEDWVGGMKNPRVARAHTAK